MPLTKPNQELRRELQGLASTILLSDFQQHYSASVH